MKRTRLEFWVLNSWRVRVPVVFLSPRSLLTPNPEGPLLKATGDNVPVAFCCSIDEKCRNDA
jgi:hypothetical protein